MRTSSVCQNVCVLVSIGVLVLTSNASAFTPFLYDACNGDPNNWDRDIGVYQHTPTIPNNGAQGAAFMHCINTIDTMSGLTRSLFKAGETTDSTLNINDGYNEVAVLAPGALPAGFTGYTWWQYSSSCFWFGDIQNIVEFDIGMKPYLAYGWPATASYLPTGETEAGYGTMVMKHEFLHGLGLEHANDSFSVMHSTAPHPSTTFCDPSFDCWGFPGMLTDEILGLRFLYPDAAITNLTVSGTRRTPSGTLEAYPTGKVNFRTQRGKADVPFAATLINASSSTKTVTVKLYLSTDPHVNSPKHTLGTYPWSAGAFNFEQDWVVYPTIPSSVPNGTYYRWVHIDAANAASEANESDNMLRMAGVVTING